MMMKTPLADNRNTSVEQRMIRVAGTGENGSVMVVVMMVLVLLTIGGISATNTAVTEFFIVRNTIIANQNLQLAENAALEGAREILSRDDSDELIPGAALAPDWFRPIADWNNDPTVDDPADDNSYPLNDNNSAVAVSDILDERDETADAPLRYYFVGWRDAPKNSLLTTGPQWRTGRVISVYNSEDYGLTSVEIGVIKRF